MEIFSNIILWLFNEYLYGRPTGHRTCVGASQKNEIKYYLTSPISFLRSGLKSMRTKPLAIEI